MNRFLLLVLIFSSCSSDHVNFNYKFLEKESGILIKNYRPVTEEQFNQFLMKVNDSLKLKSMNVFLSAVNMNEINPKFKKIYYAGQGQLDLKWNHNDTLRMMRNTRFSLGVFEEDLFKKNDDWDRVFLSNQFFIKN